MQLNIGARVKVQSIVYGCILKHLDVYGLWHFTAIHPIEAKPHGQIPLDDQLSQVLQKPADWICSASDVDKKKGRKLDPNEDLRNKGFKAPVVSAWASSPDKRG